MFSASHSRKVRSFLRQIIFLPILVLAIIWGSGTPAIVFADADDAQLPSDADDINSYLNDTAWFDPSDGLCEPSAPSGPLDRATRYKATWAYFTTQKKMTAEAVAGIMGNLEAESGIDPHNMQNSAPLPDGPELPTEPGPDGNPVPHSAIRGKFGYGIAQWTTAGRQQNLIDFGKQYGRSTGDLGLQLDYLWKELTSSYVGVMAVLQTPGVTVDQASYVVLSEFEIPRPFTDKGTPAERAAEAANRLAKAKAIYDEFRDQTLPSTAGGGCSDFGNIDLASADTTHILCSNGTLDAGTADGYRSGKLIKIRLCRVENALINSQLAGAVKQMLADSRAAGANLSINGVFRTMSAQISVYRGWCARDGITPTPPPYPRPLNEYTRCPGAAPPGYSNHQQGLALDLQCNGSLIPMSYSQASKNVCFQWLLTNAQHYGLHEFGNGRSRGSVGYEGWHWSVNGG